MEEAAALGEIDLLAAALTERGRALQALTSLNAGSPAEQLASLEAAAASGDRAAALLRQWREDAARELGELGLRRFYLRALQPGAARKPVQVSWERGG